MNAQNPSKRTPINTKSRIPEDSVFFGRIIPVALVFMGILTAVLILFAAGVLLGLVKF